MSSYADIFIDNKPIFTYRNEVSPEALALFRPEELRSIASTGPDAPAWSRYVNDSEFADEEVQLHFYIVSAEVLRERLDVLGYGMSFVRDQFNRVLAEEIERRQVYLHEGGSAELQSIYQTELTALEVLTFESWLSQVAAFIAEPMNDAVEPSGSANKNGPLGLLDDRDERLVLRVVTEATPEAQVILDITDLVDGGWVDLSSGEDSEVVESWLRRESQPIIITEGRRDVEVLQRSIALLKPHLSPYIKFLDYDFRNEGSAATAVNTIKSFAAAGISNRILVLLDNDAAAHDAVRALTRVSLPPYYHVTHYPDLDLAKRYPTLGPQGEVTMDVNCLACSIEMYLGEDVLRMKSGELMPVQWKGYMSGIRAYQGEILDKAAVNKRFDEKLRQAESDRSQFVNQDWRGIMLIIDHIVRLLGEL